MKMHYLVLAASMIPAVVMAAGEATTAAPAEKAAPAAATAPAAAATTAPASTTTAAPKQDVAEQSGFQKGSVVRSIFTSEVKDREPTDKLTESEPKQVYYFTELRDMNGQTATHRWEHEGKVITEIKFNVKGNRWRAWSSKNFVPQAAGAWKVSVVNGAGEVISEESFNVAAAAKAAAAASPAAAPAKAEAAAPAPGTSVQPAPAKGAAQ
jgi:hypothetical protein